MPVQTNFPHYKFLVHKRPQMSKNAILCVLYAVFANSNSLSGFKCTEKMFTFKYF